MVRVNTVEVVEIHACRTDFLFVESQQILCKKSVYVIITHSFHFSLTVRDEDIRQSDCSLCGHPTDVQLLHADPIVSICMVSKEPVLEPY